MIISLRCSGCNRRIRVQGRLAGQQISCPSCGTANEIHLRESDQPSTEEFRSKQAPPSSDPGTSRTRSGDSEVLQSSNPAPFRIACIAIAVLGVLVAGGAGLALYVIPGILRSIEPSLSSPPNSPATAHDQTATRTAAAWNQMAEADVVMATCPVDGFDNRIAFLTTHIRLYGAINIDGIDADLRDFIRAVILLQGEMLNELRAYRGQYREIRAQVEQAAQAGGQMGRAMAPEDPNRGEYGGALLLRGLAEAAAQQRIETLEATFQERWKALEVRRIDITQQRRSLGATLSQRYKRDFNERM